MAFNRGSIQTFKQERLAKEDIRLLITIMEYADLGMIEASDTRKALLLGKLKRMEQQK